MSDENNPYDTPDSDVEVQNSEINNLASRWSRLFAALIDALIGAVVSAPLMIHYNIFEIAMAGEEIGSELTLFLTLLGIVVFMLLHGYLLKTKGQTIGKLALGIKIVMLDGQLPNFRNLITKRYVPIWVLQLIPAINILALVDVLFIFRSDKRCVHDLIAGTKVVRIIQ